MPANRSSSQATPAYYTSASSKWERHSKIQFQDTERPLICQCQEYWSGKTRTLWHTSRNWAPGTSTCVRFRNIYRYWSRLHPMAECQKCETKFVDTATISFWTVGFVRLSLSYYLNSRACNWISIDDGRTNFAGIYIGFIWIHNLTADSEYTERVSYLPLTYHLLLAVIISM